MKSINIDEFTKQFNKEYNFLYDNNDCVAGYNEAVKAFDSFINNDNNANFVSEFARYCGDFISSDREAAAFMFALEIIEQEE